MSAYPYPQSPADQTVTITMTRKEAENISFGLSDLLCWISGFEAARAGTDQANTGPMGVTRARDLNIKIKDALG